MAFAADILAKKLRSMGELVNIVEKIDPFDACLYIIYNAASVKKLPSNYIVYQTEVAGSKWFTKKYKKVLSKALAVWEYDQANIIEYGHLNSSVFIVTPGYEYQEVTVEKDISLLFYGYVKNSQVRESLLSSISAEINLRIVENELMENMWNLLERTSIVLNIHYYKNAPLETFRINEALSFGANVISQRANNISTKYTDVIELADTKNEIFESIEKINNSTSSLLLKADLNKLKNDTEIEKAMDRPYKLKKPKTDLVRRFFMSSHDKK